MKRYDSYKDSGVEWIGEIPSHWKLMTNKYFTKSQKNKSEFGDEVLLSVSEYQGVIPRRNIREGEEHLSRSESLVGYLKVRKGELVSNIMLMWKRGLGVSEHEGIVSPSYSVFSFKKSEPKYFHYLYRTDQYVSEFRRNSTGVIESRLRLYDDSFGSLKSHFPPLPEQQQIVSFLDTKTSLIDSLIEKTQRKIELLKEKRTSLINEVVTKGLNPNVEMKDSGVEWIGEIPRDWKSKRFSYSINIQKGKIPKNLTDEQLVDSLPYLSMGVLRGDEPLEFSNESGVVKVSKGDIGLLWDGSNSGEVIRINREGILSSTVSLLSLKDNSLDKEFSFYLLKFYEKDFRENTIGMGIPHVSGDHVRESKLIIPPLPEQQQIVEYLDEQTQLIDNTISIEEKRIELLKEYRQSLISEVVTGKLKVTTDE